MQSQLQCKRAALKKKSYVFGFKHFIPFLYPHQQTRSESTRQKNLGLVNQDAAITPPLPQTSGASSNSAGNNETRSQLPTRSELATKDSTPEGVTTVAHQGEVNPAVGEATAAADSNPDVVEESGPVEYSDNEDGLDDEEMQELAYEGDPLLHSDYEEEDAGEIMKQCYNITSYNRISLIHPAYNLCF